MPISLIAAVAENGVIGKKNTLPWYLPEDLKRFRKLTTGKTVLMGRKTFESIRQKLGGPLPNRKNVVVTHNKDFTAPEDVLVFHDLQEALKTLGLSEEIIVIGGGEIYRQTIVAASDLYITHVLQNIDGDVYFPKIDDKIWTKVWEEPHDGFMFAHYMRKRVLTQTHGAAAAIIEQDGKILLVKEAHGTADRGKWNLPAGWIEIGEHPLKSVRKEVREEAGFEFEPNAIVGIYSIVRLDIFNLERGVPHGIKIVFTGNIKGQQGELSDDVSETRWFSPEEIYAMDQKTIRDLDIKAIVKDYFAGRRCPLETLTHTVQR